MMMHAHGSDFFRDSRVPSVAVTSGSAIPDLLDASRNLLETIYARAARGRYASQR